MSSPEQARRYGRWFIMTDNLLVVMGFFIVFPLISLHFVDRLGWAATLVGVALAIRQLLQQGLGLLGGTLADRYGAKPLIVSGMLLRAAGFAMMANASSPWWLIAGANRPRVTPTLPIVSWPGRSIALPIWRQWTRSRL